MHQNKAGDDIAESKDSVIRATAPTLATGRRWPAKNAVQKTKAALQYSDIVIQVKHRQRCLGMAKHDPVGARHPQQNTKQWW